LADANIRLCMHNVITAKPLVTKITNDFVAAGKAALKKIETYPYAKLRIETNVPRLNDKVDAIDDALEAKKAALLQTTNAAIRDRKENPDKYATDLSSRFAALNAFRKH